MRPQVSIALPPHYEALWEHMMEMYPADPGRSRFGGLVARQIDGPLDVELLRQSLAEVTRRHDVLRLSVRKSAPETVLEINHDVDPDVRLVDLSGCTAQEQDALVSDLVSGERRRTYQLAIPPLWTAHVVRLSPVRHLLIIAVFHLLFDGSSANVLFEETFLGYQARSGVGRPLPHVAMGLPEVTNIQLEDQRVTGQLVAGWARQLWVPDNYLRLPTKTVLPTEDLLADAEHSFKISSDVASALRDIAWRNRTTPFVVQMAVYATVMSIRMDCLRIIVSTTILGRHLPATRRLLGQFTRDVFLPFVLHPRSSLEEIVRQTHTAMLAAATSAAPFTSLASLLDPEFTSNRPWSDLHIFDTYIMPTTPDVGPLVFGDLQVQTLDPQWTPSPAHAVTLRELPAGTLPAWIKHGAPHMIIDGNRQGGVINYNRTFFESSMVKSLVADHLAVAQLMAFDPATSVSEVRRRIGH